MLQSAKQLLQKSLILTTPKINLAGSKIINRQASAAYEGDGKTTVSIMNNEVENGLMVNSYSQYGFRLSNDIVVVGPMAIFPRSVLSWNVHSHLDINEKTLSLFYALEPKIDVLVIGIGDQEITPNFSKNIMAFMQKYRINVEVLSTEQACATFNFLNAEKRVVAAALIPPSQIRINENDMMQSQVRRNQLQGGIKKQ